MLHIHNRGITPLFAVSDLMFQERRIREWTQGAVNAGLVWNGVSNGFDLLTTGVREKKIHAWITAEC
jgi:hypothetical protein